MYQALIFDLDGLLVDSEPVWEQAERDLFARHGAVYDEAIMREHIGTGIREWAIAMVQAYGLTITPELFTADLLALIVPAFEEGLVPMPGALDVVAAVHAWGGPVAIASSSNHAIIDLAVRRFGWEQAIPIRCSGEDVTYAKPAPDIYLLTAQRLGVSPSACLVLEDSLNGARAARAAGMTVIAIPNPAYTPADFADITPHILPSLTKFKIEDWLVAANGDWRMANGTAVA